MIPGISKNDNVCINRLMSFSYLKCEELSICKFFRWCNGMKGDEFTVTAKLRPRR